MNIRLRFCRIWKRLGASYSGWAFSTQLWYAIILVCVHSVLAPYILVLACKDRICYCRSSCLDWNYAERIGHQSSNKWFSLCWQRETETVHFMQVVPWLGVVPGSEAQMQQLLDDDGHSPLVSLFKSASAAVAADPETVNPQSFVTMSKQAEVAGMVAMHVKSLLLIFIFVSHYSWGRHAVKISSYIDDYEYGIFAFEFVCR